MDPWIKTMKADINKLMSECMKCGYQPHEIKLVLAASAMRGPGWLAELIQGSNPLAQSFSVNPSEAVSGLVTQLKPRAGAE